MKRTLARTKLSQNAEQAHLSDYCAQYRQAIELIGRRWTGAILRALLGGARRFNELLGAIPGLSDRLLTERLRELEAEGMVHRHVHGGPPIAVQYELTDRGRDLELVMRAIDDWAQKWIKSENDVAADL